MSDGEPTSVRAGPATTWSLPELMRFHLERVFLESISGIEVAGPLPDGRSAALFEVPGFVEIPPDELRERSTSLLGALHPSQAGFVHWVRCRRDRGYRVYYGALQDSDPLVVGPALRGALRAYYAGANPRPVPADEAAALRESLREHGAVAVLTGIPSERSSSQMETRLDEALEGLADHDFDLIVQAEPMLPGVARRWEDALHALYTDLHPLTRGTLTASESENFNRSFARSFQASLSEGTSVSDARSTSTTTSESTSESQVANEDERSQAAAGGIVRGGALGAGLGALAGAAVGSVGGPPGTIGGAVGGAKVGGPAGAQLGAMVGASLTRPVTASHGRTTSEGFSDTTTHGSTWNATRGWSASDTRSVGTQIGRQLSAEHVRRDALAVEELLEQHLHRIRTGRGMGLWRVSVHVATRDPRDLRVVCSVLQGALRGDDTWAEPLRWSAYQPASPALACLAAFQPPALALPSHPLDRGLEQLETRLGSDELVHWIRPPASDLPGFPVRPRTVFGRNAATEIPDARRVHLGRVVHRGRAVRERVSLDLASLPSHALIVGTTGSGKTTTAQRLLYDLQERENPVPFLLVEPAKSDYGALFNALEAAGRRPCRLVAGRADTHGFRFNPLQVPEGISVGRHLDAMRVLLGSAFHTDGPLPQLLERLVLRLYTDRFDLTSPWSPDKGPCPTLADLVEGLGTVDEMLEDLGYSGGIRKDLRAALRVRVESLTAGVKGVLFCGQETRLEDLLDRPVFLELRQVDDPNARRLLLGALVRRLYGIREAAYERAPPSSEPLEHLLVLEEAHHLLRKPEGHGPGVDMIRISNQMLADAFAEIRVYRQGILAIDQSPTLLDAAVLRNTNTKLAHRLLFADDATAMASAMGLTDEERVQLGRLQRGECVAVSPEMPRAVHVAVDPPLFGAMR